MRPWWAALSSRGTLVWASSPVPAAGPATPGAGAASTGAASPDLPPAEGKVVGGGATLLRIPFDTQGPQGLVPGARLGRRIDIDGLLEGCGLHRWRRSRGSGPEDAQQRSEQDLEVEGLLEVGAGAVHLGGLVGKARAPEHTAHGQGRDPALAQRPEHLLAAEVGQEHVDNRRLELDPLERSHRLPAAGEHLGHMAPLAHRSGQEGGQVVVVVEDEDQGHGRTAHRSPCAGRAGALRGVAWLAMLAFHHQALQVVDLPAMERFYRGLFNLPVLQRWPDGAGGERSIWLGLEGGFLALERAPEGAEPPAPAAYDACRVGYYVLALRIALSERTAWEHRLAASGVAVERRTAYSLFFRDPEGNRLAVSHHPHAAPGA